jgi:transposase
METRKAQAYWAGLDVSAESFDAAVFYCGGNIEGWMKIPTRKFPATRAGVAHFLQWLDRHEGTCEGLCAESTGIYSVNIQDFIDELRDESTPRLSIVNPLRIKGAARMLAAPGKTDQIDARVIAIFGASNAPPPKPPLPPAQRRLREAAKVRNALSKHALALENLFISLKDKRARRILQAAVAALKRQANNAQVMAEEVIADDPQLSADRRLLLSVPTIGPQVSMEILVLYGDMRQCSRREVIARAGLAPIPYDSGKSVHDNPHMSRRGGARLRSKQYMASSYLLTSDKGFNRHIIERFARGDNGKICICAAVRKTLTVARAVLISGKPFDPARARA